VERSSVEFDIMCSQKNPQYPQTQIPLPTQPPSTRKPNIPHSLVLVTPNPSLRCHPPIMQSGEPTNHLIDDISDILVIYQEGKLMGCIGDGTHAEAAAGEAGHVLQVAFWFAWEA
jgi:hypothetical protein